MSNSNITLNNNVFKRKTDFGEMGVTSIDMLFSLHNLYGKKAGTQKEIIECDKTYLKNKKGFISVSY